LLGHHPHLLASPALLQVSHDGKPINWDQWAITCDDPKFNGTGNPDSGDDYEAAPGD
jgi:alpha-amylase